MLNRTPRFRVPFTAGPAPTAPAPAAGTATAVQLQFKGLGAFDYPSSFAWPLQEAGSEYHSRRRSPFSVLRSRQCREGRCAAGVLPSSYSTAAPPHLGGSGPGLLQPSCGHRLCCCSALFYAAPATQVSPAHGSTPTAASASPQAAAAEEAVDRVRDDFLWSVKLADVELTLLDAVGEDLLHQLTQRPDTRAAVVLTCNDLRAAAHHLEEVSSLSSSPDAGEPLPSAAYVARMLLSAEEDNRIKWLQEESAAMDHRDYYTRAPSLRALYVMWSIQQQQQRLRAASIGGGGGGYGGSGSESASGTLYGELPRGDAAHAGPRLASSATARTPRSLVPAPTMEDIQHVLLRMEERHTAVTMADVAAMAAIGAVAAGPGTSVPAGEFWAAIAHLLKPKELASALAEAPSSQQPIGTAREAVALQHVLLLTLLLRYTTLAAAEAPRADVSSPRSASWAAADFTGGHGAADSKLLLPMSAFEAASTVIQLRRQLTPATPSASHSAPHAAVRDALVRLCEEVLRHAYSLAERSEIAPTSPHLPELTTWLLREMTTSTACAYHFKRLADRSITEALVALEKSGLVSRTSMDLQVVVRHLLPLLESCASEDLYASVLRDVLVALEEKARRDRRAFTQDDLRYLAELGTKLFASGTGESSAARHGLFDETTRGQMEELHVMDGSPWALCVSSYRSLREMAQGIVRDQRRLKQQVQDQLRQLSNATTLSAVIGGGGGADAARKRPDGSAGEGDSHQAASVGRGATNAALTPAPARLAGSAADGEEAPAGTSHADAAADSADSDTAAAPSPSSASAAPQPPPPAPQHIPVSPMLCQRFLVLVEELVKAQVDESSHNTDRPIVVSTELFAFVTQHVPVPNIQDEYRRKIFLLVNVAEAPETTRRRRAESTIVAAESKGHRKRRHRHGKTPASESAPQPQHKDGEADGAAAAGDGAADEPKASPSDDDPHGGANDIPAELRFLVSSLPLTLSPWASVMILREVLAESAGRNPRYTYVLNAAIDLQLPMSTTRSRIATTLNMWRFLNTQSHKLSLKESVLMKQRCAWNLPMAYVLSSYWSLLTWLFLASIIMLNVVGIDFESQIVANTLFRMFAPWEELCVAPTADGDDDGDEAWTTQAAADLASDYFEQAEIADRRREEHRRSSTNVFLSSASYLILGYDDQRRPMTVIPIGSDRATAAEERVAEEYAAATAVLRELSLHAPFPFFVDIERPVPVEYVEKRIAERIRRVSFNNTWFLPRMIISTFPLGRQYTEHKLILHTCTQANLTRRRITFLLYLHDGVAATPQFIQQLNESHLARHANLVLVVHESSLLKGGTTPAALASLNRPRSDNGGASALLASAAAMIDAVLPTDLRDTAGKSSSSSAGADSSGDGVAAPATEQHLRVLPYCRQYYAPDGTMIPGLPGAPAIDRLVRSAQCIEAAEADQAWWRRALRAVEATWTSLLDHSGVAGVFSGGRNATARAPARADHLPLFAAAFSPCRTSLHRSRAQQCREEDEAAAAAAVVHEQHRSGAPSRSSTSSVAAYLAVGPWLRWWRHALFGVTNATVQRLRVDRDGGWEEEVMRDEEVPRRFDGAAAPSGPPPPPPPPGTARPAPGEREAGAPPTAGANLVSLSFSALRHLMADVSAPVPAARGGKAGGSGRSGGAAGPPPGGDGSRGAKGETHDAQHSSRTAPSPAASHGGFLSHMWAVISGDDAGRAGSAELSAHLSSGPSPHHAAAAAAGGSGGAAAPTVAASWRFPYSFANTTAASTSPNTTQNGDGSSSSGAARPTSSPAPPASATTTASSSSSSGAAPSAAAASALDELLLPPSASAHVVVPVRAAKWEGAWQRTEEMLAQLRRTSRASS